MIETKSLRQSLSLQLTSSFFVFLWCLIASFPIFWNTIMSIKLPVDAFSSNPKTVIFGPLTSQERTSISLNEFIILSLLVFVLYKLRLRFFIIFNQFLRFNFILKVPLFYLCLSILFLFLFRTLNFLLEQLNFIDFEILGFTFEHYKTVWFERDFFKYFWNSVIVTSGVVIVSLTFGTLAGFALARYKSSLAFWILVIALVFRALPHSILVAGYLPFFMNSSEILRPLLGDLAPTLFGKPFAVIAVLVAINQPFTIWLMRSFFQNIPSELDEAARIDGCSHFQAFIKVIMPIMWPGVITTGLFSFMLGYNDYLVTSLLLDAQNQTMVPAISGLFNRDTSTTDQVVAVAAAVSITAPLFLLVLFFQKQIVSGLTAGAVKG